MADPVNGVGEAAGQGLPESAFPLDGTQRGRNCIPPHTLRAMREDLQGSSESSGKAGVSVLAARGALWGRHFYKCHPWPGICSYLICNHISCVDSVSLFCFFVSLMEPCFCPFFESLCSSG